MATTARRNRASRATRATRIAVAAAPKGNTVKAHLPRIALASENAERDHLWHRLAVIQREFAKFSAQAARDAPSLVGELAEVAACIREADIQLTRPERSDALSLAAAALGRAASQLALIEYRLNPDPTPHERD
jgi:hypothetical protein